MLLKFNIPKTKHYDLFLSIYCYIEMHEFFTFNVYLMRFLISQWGSYNISLQS